MDYDLHNYNYSRQQHLTQQTSTNASQDFDILQQQNYYQDQQITKSKRGRSSYQRNSELLQVNNNNNSNYQEGTQQQISQQFYEFTEVFVWGDDRQGQLGLYHQKLKKGNKDQISFKLPKTCSFNILIKQISCGESHSAILTNQGHLYMMGSNYEGQLGIGDNCPDLLNQDCAGAPCLVDRLRDYKVQSVECGKDFTFAIVSDKAQHIISNNNQQIIFGWGNNKEGQLGISTHQKVNIPTRLHFFEQHNIKIKQISAGLSHTLFLTEKGQVYATGSNLQGQLGIGQQCNQVIQPILIDELQDLEIIQVSAGDHHTLFLTSNGQVYSCGNNQLCQLGLQDVQTIQYIPTLIKALQNYKIVKIEAKQESAAISCSGELFLWGTGVFGTYKTPQKILTISNPVCNVSLGSSLGTALDSKGLLWTWGQNQLGELGVGDHDARIHPYPVLTLKGKKVTQVQCGGSFVVALGLNVKKEIPQLKLKKQRESSQAALQNVNKINSQIIRNSSQKSLGNRSVSKNKKKKVTALSKQLRKDSITSLNKIYGMSSIVNVNERLQQDAHSPKISKDSKISKILKKKNSKSSLNKSKLQELIPRSSKPKIKVKKSQSKVRPSKPFCGEDTTIIKPGFLNQSCLLVKNQNKLDIVQSFSYQQQPLLNQNLTQLNSAEYSKHQSQDGFNIENINSSSHDITNDSTQNIAILNSSSQQNTGKQSQQNTTQQTMYIPQPVKTQTNKEKLIKDLHTEIKQLRTENELLRKENRTVKQQMEQQEKHYEKLNLAQQHQQEVKNLYTEINRLEQKNKQIKQERNEFKQQYEKSQEQLQGQQNMNSNLRDENQELINQVQFIQDEYKNLQDQYHESQCRNEQYEREIKDIQQEILQINEQSQHVEKSLMEKLQKMSEKYQESLKQIEELNFQIKSDKKKLDDYAFTAKDTQFYVNALEKENSFLRQEIEKVKYNKDKDQYGKFLQNLIPIRNSNKKSYQNNNGNSENEENNLRSSQISSYNKESQNNNKKSPFKDNTQNVCNYDYYHNKEKQLDSKKLCQNDIIDEPQILKSSIFSQNQQLNTSDLRKSQLSDDKKENNDKENQSTSKKDAVDYNELRMSYNQKLLKSLEKKTLNKLR